MNTHSRDKDAALNAMLRFALCPLCKCGKIDFMDDHITIDPNVCHGKPVIANTRTPVSVILGHLSGGDSFQTIRDEYDLTDDDIRAAIAFANHELSRLTFLPTPRRKGA